MKPRAEALRSPGMFSHSFPGSACGAWEREKKGSALMIFKRVKIHAHEVGLYFHDGEFRGLLDEGRHWFFDPFGRVMIGVVSLRTPWFAHEKLDVIVKSGVLEGRALVLDLKDHERALIWIDGRFSHIVPAGLYAYWTAFRKVKAEIVDARIV